MSAFSVIIFRYDKSYILEYYIELLSEVRMMGFYES